MYFARFYGFVNHGLYDRQLIAPLVVVDVRSFRFYERPLPSGIEYRTTRSALSRFDDPLGRGYFGHCCNQARSQNCSNECLPRGFISH